MVCSQVRQETQRAGIANDKAIREARCLSQFLFESSHSANDLWRFYFMEYRLATIYNPRPPAAMEELRDEVHAVVPLRSDASEEEKALLSRAILIVSLLTTGVSSISTLTVSVEASNDAQLTEPLRRAVVESVGPAGSQLFDVIDKITEPGN